MTTKYVKSWFARGDDDLALVKLILEKGTGSSNLACFHAQQAAEKYLKGFLAHHDLHVRKIHDLEVLLEDCKNIDPSFAELEDGARFLNRFYIESRYPDDYVEFPREDAEKPLEAALRIKEFILAKVRPLRAENGFGAIGIVAMVAVLVVLAIGGYLAYQRFAKPIDTGRTACTQEVKLCPDGSSVSRTGPNCEFAPCPPEALCEGGACPKFCKVDSDCVLFSCSGAFNAEWAKTAPPDLPCIAYFGYTPQCIAQVCTAVKEVDTSTWKTYRNEKYGFEVRYPANYIAYEGITQGELRPVQSSSDQVWFGNVDWVYDQLKHKPDALSTTVGVAVLQGEKLSLLEWVEQNRQYFPNQKITDTSFLGHEAVEVEKFGVGRTIFFKQGGDLFILTINLGEPLYDQILSTFKFIR